MDIIDLLKSKNLIDIAIKDKRDRDYKLRQDVTWLIIGHPGSGKTFLCSRIALLYSDGDLEKFDYCITIPCRNPDWHSKEIQRNKEGKGVTPEFVRQWLQLGMPDHGSTRWREKLAKHLLDTEGEGLLLIVDSMDEFTQNIRVEQTLLSVLLQRKPFLSKCTLILTSRPGEWSNISGAISNIEIDFYFQVLGFSPDNRDRYFKNQLDEDKFKACLKMFHSHHEINLLSLIPVNASFFATLFRSHIATSYTLTKLYSSLILYLIKRQLCRMNLKEEKNMKAESLDELEANVRNCLNSIGEVAYLGVAERKLTSTSKFKLVLDKDEIDSQWLGLVNVSIKKDKEKTKVWSFSHLTLQEFVGALWLSNEKTRDIFLITRYVVSTNETFALFKMVMRFLCGIKQKDAQLFLYIIFKYQLVTLSYNEFPCFHQNRYESKHEDNLFNFSDCQLFTNQFISLSPFLVETKLQPLEPLALRDKKGGQQASLKNVTLYIQSEIAPNDWHNLTKSFHLFKKIHLFYFDSRYLTCQDLLSLIEELKECSVENLTIKFVDKEYSHIKEYLHTIRDLPNTVFSFNLEGCSLNDNTFIKDLEMLTEDHHISSINLSYNTISPQILEPLIAQKNQISNIYFRCRDNAKDYPILVPKLTKLTNLRGLHIFGIPDVELAKLSSCLAVLTNLQEISCYQHNAYSILSQISPLCKLSYLDISGYSEQTKGFEKHLYELLKKNSETLKTLILYKIESIGVLILKTFFDSLSEFKSLVKLKLEYCRIDLGTRKLEILTLPKSLMCLELWRVPIGDKGLLKLSKIVILHGNLRFLMIAYAKLTSKSCETLSNLMYTMRSLKRLVIFQKELLNPDETQYMQLTSTANQVSIELKCCD